MIGTSSRTPTEVAGTWSGKGHKRVSAHADTKQKAIDRAREIVRKAGGGELRIANQEGTFIDSDTITPGRESPRRDTK
jgi:hypothetical protein